MAPPSPTLSFFDADLERTIFPLKTNQWLISAGEDAIQHYIAQIFDPASAEKSFTPQQRCYGIKTSFHLRRTVKLDFVAEYYIYDLIYRNRGLFRKSNRPNRQYFGYRFQQGQAESPSLAYAAFKIEAAKAARVYKHVLCFDIASYFNSIYHHDLVSWSARLGFSGDDTGRFGAFLRETAAGRSVDCLPQGIYPAKMIGNAFLNFVDFSALSCDVYLRFMDDFFLFSNDERILQKDFLYIQELLGERGLSVNPKKTKFGMSKTALLDRQIDEMKRALLEKRRRIIAVYDEADSPTMEVSIVEPLSSSELDYIKNLLNHEMLEEEDVELILTIMGDHTDLVESKIPMFFKDFPNLAKTIARFCRNLPPDRKINNIVNDIVDAGKALTEYQLFWIVSLVQERMVLEQELGVILQKIFEISNAIIVKAKILETNSQAFGLTELREAFLRSGTSDWLSWSSAVAMRDLPAISRNHLLGYFAKSSHMNRLVADIVRSV